MEHLRSLDGGDDFDAIIWHLILMLGGCGGVQNASFKIAAKQCLRL